MATMSFSKTVWKFDVKELWIFFQRSTITNIAWPCQYWFTSIVCMTAMLISLTVIDKKVQRVVWPLMAWCSHPDSWKCHFV